MPAFSGASTVHVTCPTEAFANAGPECALTVFCTVESNAGDCVLIEKCLASVFFFFFSQHCSVRASWPIRADCSTMNTLTPLIVASAV